VTLSSAQTKVSDFPLKPILNPIYKIRFQTEVQIKFSLKLGFKPKIQETQLSLTNCATSQSFCVPSKI